MSKLKAKLALRAAKHSAAENALRSYRRQRKEQRPCNTKRKPINELRQYLAVNPRSMYSLRDPEDYRTRKYNVRDQVLALIDHTFVVYKPALFLYDAMLSEAGKSLVFGRTVTRQPHIESAYRDWFRTVARGDSLAKLKPNGMTNKETHWFLQAPDGNTIEQNQAWAKARAAGLPRDGCDFVISYLGEEELLDSPRVAYFLGVLSQHWSGLDEGDRGVVTSYVWDHSQGAQPGLHARSLATLRRMARQWWRAPRPRKPGAFESWTPTFALWEHRQKGILIRATELTSNRALCLEGVRRRHCVGTYTIDCRTGRSAIISMKWLSEADPSHIIDAVTLEVDPRYREIVQVQGTANRDASPEEMRLIRLWAHDNRLTLSEWL